MGGERRLPLAGYKGFYYDGERYEINQVYQKDNRIVVRFGYANGTFFKGDDTDDEFDFQLKRSGEGWQTYNFEGVTPTTHTSTWPWTSWVQYSWANTGRTWARDIYVQIRVRADPGGADRNPNRGPYFPYLFEEICLLKEGVQEGVQVCSPEEIQRAIDPNGDTLTYSLEGADRRKFRINSSTGAISVAPGQTFNYVTDYWNYRCGPPHNPMRACFDLRVRASDGEFSDTMKIYVWELDSNGNRGRPSSSGQTYEPEMTQDLFTATFVDTPPSHDGSVFMVGLEFSEEPASGFSYRTLVGSEETASIVQVGNGAVTRATRKVAGENRRWILTIEPENATDYVSLGLSPARDCSANGSVCTEDGRPLAVAVSWLILPAPVENPGSNANPVPLTVAYEQQPPPSHDGEAAFSFSFGFSEELVSSYSFATMRDHSLRVMQGETGLVPHVRRVAKGSNQRWEVTVTPAGNGDISVALASVASCSDTGAMCSEGGQVLSNALPAVTILGPPGLSVADASVQEAANASLDFPVTLSRAASATVTVDYATSDGTATAGSDYTATSGTLTFNAGDTAKTVSVPVLSDLVNEGAETLTLTLSGASGADAYLADASATGTINNDGPMPRAWLTRFGRSAAAHVLDAVQERLDGGSGESWARLGGHRLGAGTPGVMESARRLSPPHGLFDEGRSPDPAGQLMTLDQLLLGSAFHLVTMPPVESSGPRLTAWGRVTTNRFDADEDHMVLHGTVTTATLGVDGVWERWLTGLALAYSKGDGSFRQPGQPQTPESDVASSLTSVHPYVGFALSERVQLWGVAGFGAGSLELVLSDRDPMRTDIDMTMGAVGVRGSVVSTPGGLELAVRSDALWVSTGSEATVGMAAAEAATNRLRLVLEGSRPFGGGAGGTLTPMLEVGLRRDGGDAEEGSGVEVGGRIVYDSPSGLSIEAALRALVAHEASAYQEWGASGTLRYDPGRAGLGMTASLMPAWGMAAGGVGRLWSQPDARGLAGEPAPPAGRLDAALGYGLRALNGQGILTPYARASLVEGSEHAWHLGTRLTVARALEFSLEAAHRQMPDQASAQELALLATVPW